MVKLSHERRNAVLALSSRMTRMMIGVALSAIATGEAYAQAVPSTSDAADTTNDTAVANSAVEVAASDSDTPPETFLRS